MLTEISRALAIISGASMLFASVWIGVDVFLRLLFNSSLPGSIEISGFILAIGSSWAFAYALFTKSHVRVDTVYVLMPKWLRPWLDLIALSSLASVVGVLCYRSIELTVLSYQFESKSQLQLPLWIPQALWAFGLVYFLISIIGMILAVLNALRRGDTQLAINLASIDSVEAEIKAELDSAESRKRNQQ